MLAADSFAEHLSDLEQLGVILAAIIHDVGHPGVSNDFLIRTQSEVGWSWRTQRGTRCLLCGRNTLRLQAPC